MSVSISFARFTTFVVLFCTQSQCQSFVIERPVGFNSGDNRQLPSSQSKLTAEDARSALVKLVQSDFENQVGKYVKGDELKEIVAFFTSPDRRTALKKDAERRYDEVKGYVFIGNWAIHLAELTFYGAIARPAYRIDVRGKISLNQDKVWTATVTGFTWGTSKGM